MLSVIAFRRLAALAAVLIVVHTVAGDVPVVRPTAETVAMNGRGDVADDACIWIDPVEPARSVLIATCKSAGAAGGLYAFTLSGARFGGADRWTSGVNWFAAGKKMNNVDVRSGFPSGPRRRDLVCASNRTDRTIDVFGVRCDAKGHFAGLELVGRIDIGDGFAAAPGAPYGLAMYHSRRWNRYFVLASDHRGRVAQFELLSNPRGKGAERVTARRHDDGGRPWAITPDRTAVEGIVADDELDVIYIAGEDHGIWRFHARKGVLDAASRVLVAAADRNAEGRGPLVADVEGMAIYYAADGAGYLIASCQGPGGRSRRHRLAGTFAVFDRRFSPGRPNAHRMNFAIGASPTIDAVQQTDGIDVSSADFGGRLAGGVFIAHDGAGSSPTNFKLVPWGAIARVAAAAKPKASKTRGEAKGIPGSRHPVIDCRLKPEKSVGLTPTRDKPQSKVWFARGTWWAWLPYGTSGGGRIWRRDGGGRWVGQEHLDPLAQSLPGRADIWADDDEVVAVLLGGSQFATARLRWNESAARYDPAGRAVRWRWPENARVRTVTIDRTDDGEFWVAYPVEAEPQRQVVVRRMAAGLSGPPGRRIVLADGLGPKETCAIVRVAGGVGVMWSDQRRQRLCFRRRGAGGADDAWGPVEIVAAGNKTADDHVNFAMPRGPGAPMLVAATKTSLDTLGRPLLCLRTLTNRGRWASVPFAVYARKRTGPSRPIVLWAAGRPAALYTNYTPAGEVWLQAFRPDGLQAEGKPRLMFKAGSPINNVTGPKREPAGRPCLVLVSDRKGRVWEGFVGPE